MVPDAGSMLMLAIKVSVLAGIALAVSLVPRLSAAVRHAVLIAALGGALVMPVWGAILPPLSPVTLPERPLVDDPGLARVSDEIVRLLIVRPDVSSALPGREASPLAAHPGVIAFAVWCLGTVLSLVMILVDVRAARRVAARAREIRRLKSGVRVLESADITMPVTVGIFRPAIVLPAGVAFTEGALRSVIAHELSHVERRDGLTQLVARLAVALYWFHPFVRLAARRAALERERACDDRVLGTGEDPIRYSELLIDVARRHRRTGFLRAAPSMAQPGQLERRVASILDPRAARGAVSPRGLVILTLAAAAVIAPIAAFGIHDRPPAGFTAGVLDDPESERVPGSRPRPVTGPLATDTGATGWIAALAAAADREPSGPHDLVPDRARWVLELSRDGHLVESLRRSLSDDDWRVRCYAAWGLTVAGDRGAVPALIERLDDPVWRTRAMAAAALRSFGDPRAAEAMSRRLTDPAWPVRAEAAGYFGALGDGDHAARIDDLRNDPHIAVRLAADEALDRLK